MSVHMKRSFRLYMIPNLYVIVININKSHYLLTTDVFCHVSVELQLQSCSYRSFTTVNGLFDNTLVKLQYLIIQY